MSFTKVLDGRGQAPRPVQLKYFTHLVNTLKTHKYHVLSGPPGIGKSYIARTIQRTIKDTAILTTDNALVDQYTDIYPDLNGLKGKDYYNTLPDYYAARKRVSTTDTVFNPLSYYYYHLQKPDERASTIIVDEAHKLAGMLLLTLTRKYACQYFNIPLDLDEDSLLQWLDITLGKISPLTGKLARGGSVNQLKLLQHYEQLHFLRDYLRSSLKSVRVEYESLPDRQGVMKTYLTVTPLKFPPDLLATIFGASTRFIFMSGSISQFDMDELLPNQEIDFYEVGPLAPLENRRVYHTAISQKNRKDIPTQAARIKELYEKHNQPNTLVHVSYYNAPYLAKALREFNLPIILHDRDSKAQKLQEFKDCGGILLACGMAEGVDLPGDLCRLIIIPQTLYPNKGDSGVKKRLDFPNGQLWYQMVTVMTTIQQLGRGIRGADDQCYLYVLDCFFPQLISKTRRYLPKDFTRGIQW